MIYSRNAKKLRINPYDTFFRSLPMRVSYVENTLDDQKDIFNFRTNQKFADIALKWGIRLQHDAYVVRVGPSRSRRHEGIVSPAYTVSYSEESY